MTDPEKVLRESLAAWADSVTLTSAGGAVNCARVVAAHRRRRQVVGVAAVVIVGVAGGGSSPPGTSGDRGTPSGRPPTPRAPRRPPLRALSRIRGRPPQALARNPRCARPGN